MKITENEQKIPILISALEERYKSIHAIRDRVQSMSLWILGILAAASGWLLTTETAITSHQKLFFILGGIIIFILIRFSYLEDLNKGFKAQQQAATRAEKSLGLYEEGVFNDEAESIYPKGWQNAGKMDGAGKFFETSYSLIYAGFAFLLLAILLNGGLSCIQVFIF